VGSLLPRCCCTCIYFHFVEFPRNVASTNGMMGGARKGKETERFNSQKRKSTSSPFSVPDRFSIPQHAFAFPMVIGGEWDDVELQTQNLFPGTGMLRPRGPPFKPLSYLGGCMSPTALCPMTVEVSGIPDAAVFVVVQV